MNCLKFKAPKNIIWGFVCLALLILLYKTVDNFDSVKIFVGNVMSILKPFFIGFVIAYILNIPCTKIEIMLEKSKYGFLKKRSRAISIGFIYVIFAAVLVLFIRMLIPAIYKNIMDLYTNMPYYTKVVMEYLAKFELADKINLLNIDPYEIMKKITEWAASIDFSKFGQYAQGVINVTSGVIDAFLAIIISIYMLIDKKQIKKYIKYAMGAFVQKETVERAAKNAATFNDILSKYIYCQLLDAFIVAVLSIIVMSIIRVKYALVLGILIGMCNLIPYFGAIIAIVITIFVTCFTDGIAKGIWTFVLLIVMQQIDANIIGPRIMGNSLELRPLMVIFAVTLGGGLFGVPGMILSVPVFAMLKIIAERYIRARAEANACDESENGEEQ